MKKIQLLAMLVAVTLAMLSCGKSSEGVIGISKIVSHPALDSVEKGIQDELANDKYRFDLQNANGEISTASSIAAKFKSDKVVLAVGIATPTAQALANTLKNVPVVFAAITDPVSAGLVKSIDKGYHNVAGVSDLTPVRAQIEFLNKIKPIKRLGFIYTSSEDNAVALSKLLKAACDDLKIELVQSAISNSSEVKQAANSIVKRVDAFYITTDNTVVSAISAICDVAMKNNIPVMSADPSSAEKNSILAAWGFDYYKMGRATGRMVRDILKGKKPEDIPVKYMTEASDIDLLINLDVAKKLGLSFPPDVVKLANKTVENGKFTKK
jgi:putative tryptophan/tyrosine transport system substrate-binding protein